MNTQSKKYIAAVMVALSAGLCSSVYGAANVITEYRSFDPAAHVQSPEVVGVTRNYYEVLGVAKKASVEEIRVAYRKLAVKVHPDKHPGDAKAAEAFRELSEAYQVLSNEQKRKMYDKEGFKDLNAPSSENIDNEVDAFFKEEEPNRPKDYWNAPLKFHDKLQFAQVHTGHEEDYERFCKEKPTPPLSQRLGSLTKLLLLGAIHGVLNNMMRRKAGQEAKVFFRAPFREWLTALLFMRLGTGIQLQGLQYRFFMPYNRKERVLSFLGNVLYAGAQTFGEMTPLPGYPQVGKFAMSTSCLWPIKDLIMFAALK